MERALAKLWGIDDPDSEAWRAHFKPDVCDPMPVPLQSLQEGGVMPSTPPTPPPGCGAGFGCTTVLRNQIVVDGRVTSASTSVIPPGTRSNVTFRFCDCRLLQGAYTGSLLGREQCGNHQPSQCRYNPGLFDDPNGPWKPIRTYQSGSWQVGATYTGAVGGDFHASWDFLHLGAPTVQSTASGQRVTGVLWASIRSLSPTVPGLLNPALQTWGASLGTGDATWFHKQNTPRLFHPARDEAFCDICPQGFLSPYYEVGNPDWRGTIEAGSILLPAPDASTVAHFEQVAAGTVRHVPASEPLRILQRFRSGQSFVRSLGVEGQAVTRVLTSHDLGRLPVRSAWSTSHPGPAAASGRAYALSALRQRLYVIGGIQPSGAPRNEGFMLELGTGVWRPFTIPSTESVGTVFSATYRWQDMAVYFLDKVGTQVRLRRWNAQRALTTGVVQTLATFPSSWSFPKVDLVNTPDGHLMLVGWSGTGTEKTRVGLVTVSPESRVALARVHKSSTPVLAPPSAGPTGFTTITRGASPVAAPDPYAVTVAFSAMSSPSSFDHPTVHPH